MKQTEDLSFLTFILKDVKMNWKEWEMSLANDFLDKIKEGNQNEKKE